MMARRALQQGACEVQVVVADNGEDRYFRHICIGQVSIERGSGLSPKRGQRLAEAVCLSGTTGVFVRPDSIFASHEAA